MPLPELQDRQERRLRYHDRSLLSMAAIRINDTDDGLWIGAAWIFRYIVDDLVTEFEDLVMRMRLEMAVQDGSHYLNLSDLDFEDRRRIRDRVLGLVERLQTTGPTAIGRPDFYDGLLEQLRTLSQCLARDRKPR
jgi:hypothetical protein